MNDDKLQSIEGVVAKKNPLSDELYEQGHSNTPDFHN